MDEKVKNQRFNQRRERKPVGNQEIMEHGKIPPQAVDLEEAVLGAMMLEKDALATVIDILKPELFYKEAHQLIYSAIYRLFSKSEPIDILTVTNELKRSGELDTVGGPFYITQLTSRVASAANIEYHARIVSQKYIQRELIKISTDIVKDAFEDTTDVFDLLDRAEQNLFSVSESNLRRNYSSMQELVGQAIKEIEAAKTSGGIHLGVASGFTELDRVTGGWQKSDLIILASRPGMGKTAFALTLARNAAIDYKKPVAFFSLEMSAIQLVMRLISAESMLPAEKLRKGTLENYEFEQLNTKIGSLIDAPLFIDDTPALSIFELRAKCRRLKAQQDIQMIVVDYLQLMSVGYDSKSNREQEISNISRSLKSLAKELAVPIIALSQLSRAVETRSTNKKPILSDLRESGAIEQDADLVIFIYRPEYYNIDEDPEGHSTAGLAEISIAKHRNGPLKEVTLRFIGKFARFVDPGAEDFEVSGSYNEGLSAEKESKVLTIPSKLNEMEEDDIPF